MNMTVTLRTGHCEAKGLVLALYLAMENLVKEDPIAFFELVQMAKDLQHKPFGLTGKTLADLSLLEPNGSMHSSIRNIVLASVEGDMMDLCLIPLSQVVKP